MKTKAGLYRQAQRDAQFFTGQGGGQDSTTRYGPFSAGIGQRFSSLVPGTNQAVSGSSGCTATANPKDDGVMPALGLSDEDVANALTFVFSQWGNAGHEVTPAEVKAVRAEPVKKP